MFRVSVCNEEVHMNTADLWLLAWEALQALGAHYGPAIDHAAEGIGIPLGEWYGWLMAARIFEPYPVSAARLQMRAAYIAPARFDDSLAKGVQLGLLEPAGGTKRGEYHLTERGHRAIRRLIDTAYAAMSTLHPLPDADLERLDALLYRLVRASLAAPEPPGKWCLRIARHYDPGESAAAMVRLDQYLSDLDAYRDDAHLAAWQPCGVSGQAWEAFTTLWRHGPLTLDQLATRLWRRGHAQETYALALDELAVRGWIARDGDAYQLTDEGRSQREAVEATTDHYFYAPWSCLSASETAELSDLLVRVREGLAEALPEGQGA
jgi:hypothetical protein